MIFPHFRSEMSLRDNKKFSTWEKIEALKFIDTLPKKPTGKDYSDPELAILVTQKLKRKVSKTSIRNWRKSKSDLMAQPEAILTKKPLHRRCHVLSSQTLLFEQELEKEVSLAYSRGNVTLMMVCLLANYLLGRRNRLTGSQTNLFGRKKARNFLRRNNYSYRRVQGLGSKTRQVTELNY